MSENIIPFPNITNRLAEGALEEYVGDKPEPTISGAVEAQLRAQLNLPAHAMVILDADGLGYKVPRVYLNIRKTKDRMMRVSFATAEDLRTSCHLERRGSHRRLWMEQVLTDYAEQLKDGATLGDLFPELRPDATAASR